MTGKPATNDHKQPKDSIRHVTVHGVELTIDPNIFDDLDIVEDLYDMQHADSDPAGSFKIVPLLRKICGDGYEAVKTALRDPDTGRIGMEAVSEFTQELMQAVNPN